MENFSSHVLGKLDLSKINKESVTKKIQPVISRIMDIKTFEEGIRKGIYSDDKGTAYLILNGTLYNSYNVYIDRQRITKAGSVVSFESLLKSYAPDEIQIRYDVKEQKLPTLRSYIKDERNK